MTKTREPLFCAIIDATLIQSAARPGAMEHVVVDREEDEDAVLSVSVQRFAPSQSVDPDARWIRKGNRTTYGYKGFAVVSAKDGCIQRVMVTPANVSETTSLAAALGDLQPDILCADKGYTSAKNR